MPNWRSKLHCFKISTFFFLFWIKWRTTLLCQKYKDTIRQSLAYQYFRKCRMEVKWFTGAVRGTCRLLDWPGSDGTGGRLHHRRRPRSFPGCRAGRSGTVLRARGRGGLRCVKARTGRNLLHPGQPRLLPREGDGGLPCPLHYQALRDHRGHPGGRRALHEGSNLARRGPKTPICNCTTGIGEK